MKKKISRPYSMRLLFSLCSSANAQQTGKIPHIGSWIHLDGSTASGSAVLLEAFRQEMRKLGWIEGKNITIEYRFAEQKNERLPELAADLVRLKVDLIVTSGGPTPLAVKGATSTIPIVMTSLSGPRGCRFGCQSGAAGRQCHRARKFRARAKYEKARDTQGRSAQAHTSWNSRRGAARARTANPQRRRDHCG